MKATVLLICLFVLFSNFGNIKYLQYYRVESTDTQKTQSGFVFENDSVKITYTFWANGGKMQFQLYNKLDKPLYIDWKKSSLIANADNFFYYYDSLSADYLPDPTSFLPPKSRIVHTHTGIINQYISDWKGYETTLQVRNDMHKKTTKIFLRSFSAANSPLVFRNFLTLSYTENFQHPFNIDNTFYVNEVQAMDVRNFREQLLNDQWEYYYQKETDFYLEK